LVRGELAVGGFLFVHENLALIEGRAGVASFFREYFVRAGVPTADYPRPWSLALLMKSEYD
jgi:hypothetical protein